MSNMMLQMLCNFLLLGLLTGRAAVQGHPSDNVHECGENTLCEKFANLMSAVTEIKNQLDELATNVHKTHDKQSKDLEEVKENLNRSLASSAAISAQLSRHSTDLTSHDGRLQAHDVSQGNEYRLVQGIYGAELGPRDCSDIRARGYNASGIYRVYPGSDDKRIETDVYCDFKSVGQSWLVFQRRRDGSVNFERTWKDYVNGFGNLNGEFWLGNEKLSLLTMNRKYKLRVELEDFTGEKRYAEYTTFSVKPATDKYRLTVGGYSGNAGDSLISHNGMQFSTKDVDNDKASDSCAIIYRGAWWYGSCHQCNLNGLYLRGSHTSFADGIEWYVWRGYHYSLKTTEMKITAI